MADDWRLGGRQTAAANCQAWGGRGAAQLAAAGRVCSASGNMMPISSTHRAALGITRGLASTHVPRHATMQSFVCLSCWLLLGVKMPNGGLY